MIHNSITGQQISTNFTKGGMKKLMEDAATYNVQATYFASSAGIRVEEGQGGLGYLSSIMKKAEYAYSGG